jgi:ABC-type transporter Mla MlaB component
LLTIHEGCAIAHADLSTRAEMSTCRTQASCANLRAERCDAYGSSRLEDLREIGTAVAPRKGAVLRITPEERGGELFLKLEGRLRGSWVGELRLLWDSIRAEAKQSALRVDLADVDHVDLHGKALLSEMHRSGVEIITHNFLTQAICDEIVADAEGSHKKG